MKKAQDKNTINFAAFQLTAVEGGGGGEVSEGRRGWCDEGARKTVCSAQQRSPSQPRRIRLMKCSQAVIVVMRGQIAKKGERWESSGGPGRRTAPSAD